jgi:hypothetical protein
VANALGGEGLHESQDVGSRSELARLVGAHGGAAAFVVSNPDTFHGESRAAEKQTVKPVAVDEIGHTEGSAVRGATRERQLLIGIVS